MDLKIFEDAESAGRAAGRFAAKQLCGCSTNAKPFELSLRLVQASSTCLMNYVRNKVSTGLECTPFILMSTLELIVIIRVLRSLSRGSVCFESQPWFNDVFRRYVGSSCDV